MTIDYMKAASETFEGTKYNASDTDIVKLATNMEKLEERSMSKLNSRLLEGGRKIWDTFSEHNFAIKLISFHPKDVEIFYEPDEGLRRPPDFKIVLGELTYWIQMKRLSNLKRENKQRKIIRIIKNEARKINVGFFFGFDLAENFSDSDIPDLISYLETIATKFEEGKKYKFTNEGITKAEIDFWHPNKSGLSSLTLGISGDMDVVEETGLAKNQIKQSLINAAGAFEWDVDPYTINLVAMDANKHEDIDLCDAVFGTEYEVFKAGRFAWCRQDDGFFMIPEFSNKVSGLIALKSMAWNPIVDYYATLYVNNNFKDQICELGKILTFNNIIYFNMRPPMGQGNFDIT